MAAAGAGRAVLQPPPARTTFHPQASVLGPGCSTAGSWRSHGRDRGDGGRLCTPPAGESLPRPLLWGCHLVQTQTLTWAEVPGRSLWLQALEDLHAAAQLTGREACLAAIHAALAAGAPVNGRTSASLAPKGEGCAGGCHVYDDKFCDDCHRHVIGSSMETYADEYYTALHWAARNTDPDAAVAAIQTLVAAGADVEARDLDWRGPLHHAAGNPSAEAAVAIIRALVAAGADVSAFSEHRRTPLHDAAFNPSAEVAAAVIHELLAHGASVDEWDDDGYEPLHYAARNQNAEAVVAAMRALIAAGSDLETLGDGHTPLEHAARNNNAEAAAAAVRTLLAAGADVGARNFDLRRAPLHCAAVRSNAEAARLLLAAGADVRAKDRLGRTPLALMLRETATPAQLPAATLLLAGPTDEVLDDLRGASNEWTRLLLPAFIARHAPLTDAQWEAVWALVPTAPCPGLGRTLPAALASSVAQASQVVRRLPPADAQRLRTCALCMARTQRLMAVNRRERDPLWPEYLPPGAVQRILSFCLA